MEEKKTAQTSEETARELSELADRLADMDRADGKFGEAMTDALNDNYLEEVVGGLAALPLTTLGDESVPRVCTQCGTVFFSKDLSQKKCYECLKPSDRGPM